jgi:hypothetical protein
MVPTILKRLNLLIVADDNPKGYESIHIDSNSVIWAIAKSPQFPTTTGGEDAYEVGPWSPARALQIENKKSLGGKIEKLLVLPAGPIELVPEGQRGEAGPGLQVLLIAGGQALPGLEPAALSRCSSG